jgi:hypothetical protein
MPYINIPFPLLRKTGIVLGMGGVFPYNEVRDKRRHIMRCSICGMEIESMDEAIDEGWIPYFYDGETEHGARGQARGPQKPYPPTPTFLRTP